MFNNPAVQDINVRLANLTNNALNAVIPAPTVSVTPTGGSATNFSYVVVAHVGADTIPTLASITTGGATLSATVFNTIAWSPVPAPSTNITVTYDVWRTAGGATQGLIASGLTVFTLVDNGLASTAGTAPVRNTSGTVTLAAGEQNGVSVISATGAGVLLPNAGLSIITASGAATVTLAAPVATTDDGVVLRVTSTTAQAHTITTPTNKINSNKHIATFAALADTITLTAYQGIWYATGNTTTLS